MAALAPNLVYAAGAEGNSGVIYRYDGSSWTRVYQGAVGQTFRHVWASGPDDVWAVGNGGTAVHWNGLSWLAVNTGTPIDLQGVAGVSPRELYAVGAGGLILHAKR